MRTLRTLVPAISIVLLLPGCTSQEVVRSGCEIHHTAVIIFRNSTTDTTFDASVDGTALGSIAPGEEISRDVSAGRPHTPRCCLPISGDSCTARTDTFAECSVNHFDCTMPACVTQNTARISLFNDSRCCPFEVYVDGVKAADLGPNASTDVVVSADAVHPVEFRWEGTTYCAENYSVLPCHTYSMRCSRS